MTTWLPAPDSVPTIGSLLPNATAPATPPAAAPPPHHTTARPNETRRSRSHAVAGAATAPNAAP